MKKKLKIAVLIVILAALTQINIFASEEHGRDIEIIIDEILENSQSETLAEVSVDQVSPDLLEELGDAVMGLVLIDEWQHERMDAMLGGEGSYQLSVYHRNLGEQYILADGNISAAGGYGGLWMHGGMFNFSRFSPYRFRVNPFAGRINWYWGLPVLLAVAILIVLAVSIPLSKRRKARLHDNPALVILKSRFARGEISQEEYRRMEKLIRG